jgi:hypothetical protein
VNRRGILLAFLLIAVIAANLACSKPSGDRKKWVGEPQKEWPQISMVNQIEYADTSFPIAGCSFLLDTGEDTVAVTAKHVLTYFKSETMNSVSFGNTLRSWKMFPKDNPDDVVVVGALINEDTDAPIDRVPPGRDWLLFSIKEKSANIVPLKFRDRPFEVGEDVYIIGWRYSDRNCSQRIYEGNYVESEDGTILISTKLLKHNTMPGLSGAPVIDSNGRVIGLMSQKHGELERLSSINYPKEVLGLE